MTMKREHPDHDDDHEEAMRLVIWMRSIPDHGTVHLKVNGVVVGKAPVASLSQKERNNIELYALETFGPGTYVCAAYYDGGIRSHIRFHVGRADQNRWGNTRDETLAVLAAENPATSTMSPLEEVSKVAEILAPAFEAQREEAQKEKEFQQTLVLEWIRSLPNAAEQSQALSNQMQSMQRINEMMRPAQEPEPIPQKAEPPPLMRSVWKSVTKAARSIDVETAETWLSTGMRLYEAAKARKDAIAEPQTGTPQVMSAGGKAHPAFGPGNALHSSLKATQRAQHIGALARFGRVDEAAKAVLQWVAAAQIVHDDNDAVVALVRRGPSALFDAIADSEGVDVRLRHQVHAGITAHITSQRSGDKT